MREGLGRHGVAEKGTKLLPAIARRQVEYQQVLRPVVEILQHLAVMALVARDVGRLVALRAPGVRAVDPAPHRRFGAPEIAHLAANPGLCGPAREDEFAAGEVLVEFTVEDRPGIVLEGIVVADPGQRELDHLAGDVRVLGAERASHSVAELAERQLEAGRAGLVEADAEDLGAHGTGLRRTCVKVCPPGAQPRNYKESRNGVRTR